MTSGSKGEDCNDDSVPNHDSRRGIAVNDNEAISKPDDCLFR